MKAAQLLEHFDRLSEAPGAVPRLRRFILDLAVRGKLVTQDAGDEPAGELLKRIRAEKSKGDKRQIAVAKFAAADSPCGVPLNWVRVPLIALGSWAIGAGFPKNEQGLTDCEYFFLKVSDMNLPGNEKYITTSQNSVDADAAKRMRANLHPAGTIIFPKIGGAIATNKRRILTKCSAIDNNCLGITFSREIDGDWAYLILTSLDFTQYQVGTAVPALQQAILEQIAIGLPPIAEQHRIVAKVDELMALCDQLEAAQQERERRRDRLAAASLQRLNQPAAATDSETQREHARFHLHHLPRLTTRPEHIKALRQTILNLAVRGKLLEQDANDEPAVELLKRINAEKARLVKLGLAKAGKPLPEIEGADDALLPASWHWSCLAEVGFISPRNVAVDDQLVSFVSMPMIAADYGPPNLQEVRPWREIKSGYTHFAEGDVGLAKITPCFENGKSTVFRGLTGGIGAGTTELHIVRPVLLSADYILIFLKSSRYISTGIPKMTGTAGQKRVPTDYFTQSPFPLPPLAEQHRIVAKVDELMALCDQLEAQLTTTRTDSRRLLEAVLDAALAPA